MLSRVRLLFHTLIHLKRVQIYYQLFYKLRSKIFKARFFANLKGYNVVIAPPQMIGYTFVPSSTTIEFSEDELIRFTFLNLSHEFAIPKIDWNFEEKGKLWNYNLNYFEFLFSHDLHLVKGRALIERYCDDFDSLSGGLEPYPISLRGINWIKYMSINGIKKEKIDRCLYRQYKILFASLEYHILANHLLENAFSLIFAAYYFKNKDFYDKAKSLLIEELEEQLLQDGAHFERSPMYHQILLFRLLDTVNLVQNNEWKAQELLQVLVEKAEKMLAWIGSISFQNGDIPMVKDATPGIAPTTEQLINYAGSLGIVCRGDHRLKESGYRNFKIDNLELRMDVGKISPSYQPGHAHADELNFLVYANNIPVIVDSGISTYEKNDRRRIERSTASHNCVHVDGQSSSQVWGGFRVAQRANVFLLEDLDHCVIANHNGFARFGVMVTRRFETLKDGFMVEDVIESDAQEINEMILNLHFHPDSEVQLSGNQIITNEVHLTLTGFEGMAMENYMFASGFNQLREAKRARLKPSRETRIVIKHAS